MTAHKFEISVSRVTVPMGQAMVPEVFSCHLFDFEDQSPNVDIIWQVVEGSPVCREVRIRAVQTDNEVRCSRLAGVRVEDLLEKTIKAMLWTDDLRRGDDPAERIFPSGAAERDAVGEVRTARAGRKKKVTDQLLREVADVYRANVANNPTAAVADHFEREPRTARLYVKRARDKGFLGQAIQGKAGEQ